MHARRVALIVLPCIAPWGVAWAQLSPSAKMSLASANQLGIVEYCHDHNLASAEALEAEREASEGGPSSNLSTVRVRALGRQGFSVGPDGGDQITIAELAGRQAMTVPALCKDLADASLQFQAEMRKAARELSAESAPPAPGAPLPRR